MSQPERTRVSRWSRLRSFAVGKYKAIQLSIERRSFEHKLETIVRAALAHQSGGLGCCAKFVCGAAIRLFSWLFSAETSRDSDLHGRLCRL
jgi:hypothetical protein